MSFTQIIEITGSRSDVHAHPIRLVACACVFAFACRSGEHGSPIYVTNEIDGTVSVVDPDASKVLATIPVGKRPRGLRVSGDGKTLYVALSGSPRGGPGVDESTLPPPDRSADGIGVIDLGSRVLSRVIESGPDPEAFDLVGDSQLAVANEDAGMVSFVDLASGRVTARVAVGREPEGVTTAPDDRTVYVTSETDGMVFVIDVASRAVAAKIPTGKRPRSIVFSADGTRAFVADENDASVTVIDTATRAVTGTTALPPDSAGHVARPMGTARAADGSAIYVTTGRGQSLAILDPRSGALVRTIAGVGGRPWGVAVRGGKVFTANGSTNDVAVIEPGTGKVRRIVVGMSPWGVAVAP